jgi:hypothetical protein
MAKTFSPEAKVGRRLDSFALVPSSARKISFGITAAKQRIIT